MRVIAGRFKGFELKAPKTGTRPTTDRTKEAIFSRLESWGMLDDTRILDLFAGTGALGIEALSRGARELVSVESAAAAASLIAAAFAGLKRHRSWEQGMRARLVRKRAEQFVAGYVAGGANAASAGGRAVPMADEGPGSVRLTDGPLALNRFDVIFIDPPYAFATDDCNRLLADLVQGGLAGRGTVIVLERSVRSDDPTPPEGWSITDRRDYGETAVFYIEAA